MALSLYLSSCMHTLSCNTRFFTVALLLSRCDCGKALSSCGDLITHYAKCPRIAENRRIYDEYQQACLQTQPNRLHRGSQASSAPPAKPATEMKTEEPPSDMDDSFSPPDSLSLFMPINHGIFSESPSGQTCGYVCFFEAMARDDLDARSPTADQQGLDRNLDDC